MDEQRYTVAIIGSGPAGLSAAARASQLGLSHVLLEAQGHLADTIHKYQKGKHVMAEPSSLALRSALSFAAGTRESILKLWRSQARSLGVNVQFQAVAQSITGEHGSFWIGLESGELISAQHVVLAIGLQGNLRRLEVPGSQLPDVQYQLDDPADCQDETVVVVGAGDAAIENALALVTHGNRVLLLNRSGEFSRCKDGNLQALEAAVKAQQMALRTSTTIQRIDPLLPQGGAASSDGAADKTVVLPGVDLTKKASRRDKSAASLKVTMNTPQGEEVIEAHRVIARLGAIPPRKLVEGFGVDFSGPQASALPVLSTTYESSVKGLYIIGALAGYPLIKQAMNQGYEVIESICGREVVPADQPLLEQKFAQVMRSTPGIGTVADVLQLVWSKVPWMQGLNAMQMRELMIDSEVHICRSGQVIFNRNDYSNSFFSIVAGTVHVELVDDSSAVKNVPLGEGDFFGELGLISGRRRSSTVRSAGHCLLVETPRRTMLKVLASVESVRMALDDVAVRRAVRQYVAPDLSEEALSQLVAGAEIRSYRPGERLFSEGDPSDGLYLIRKGSVTVGRAIAGKEVLLSYVAAGHYVGEMALVQQAPRSATVRAAVPTEAIVLKADQVTELVARDETLRQRLDAQFLERTRASQEMTATQNTGNLVSFLLQQGAGEATDVLLIDESMCIRCDNCERACASTHEGTSRLDRRAGPTFNGLHVPTSCRHCEHPHCMKDCPPDAIRRSPEGEVYITDACIGCGNCEQNCPYGVIQMAQTGKRRGVENLWAWLFLGLGREPGDAQASPSRSSDSPPSAQKKAVKCDMCRTVRGGPACVRSCPTGAAIRITPAEFIHFAGLRRG